MGIYNTLHKRQWCTEAKTKTHCTCKHTSNNQPLQVQN